MHSRPLDYAGGGQDADRDRQVVSGALLLDVSRRQIGGNAPGGEIITGILQRRLDAILALLDRTVRQTDGSKGGETGGNINFDIHQNGIYSDQGTAENLCEHNIPPTQKC